jgi:hypothetical protein
VAIPEVDDPGILALRAWPTPHLGKKTESGYNNLDSQFEASITSDKVTVYNISNGFNKDLKEKCEPLAHFTTFLDKIKENLLDKLTTEEAVTKAIEDCITMGIMEKFLSKNRGRIVEMYVKTTDYEEELKLEARREGHFDAVKVLVSKENWSLSKAAELFGLNETEQRQVADELGAN